MKTFANTKPMMGRKCGDCQVCCSRLEIKVLNKPVNVACQHLCSSGCGIYPDRPKACSEFECGWLMGWLGGESHRPDKFGIMFSVVAHNGKPVLHAWEVWAGSSDDEKVREKLKELGRIRPLVLVKFDGTQLLIGRPSDNQRFVKEHRHKICEFDIPDNMIIDKQTVELFEEDGQIKVVMAQTNLDEAQMQLLSDMIKQTLIRVRENDASITNS